MTTELIIHVLSGPDEPSSQKCAWCSRGHSVESTEVRTGTLADVSSLTPVPDTVVLALPTELILTHATDVAHKKVRNTHRLLLYDAEPSLSLPLADWHTLELPRDRADMRSIACVTNLVMSNWCSWMDRVFPDSDHKLVSESWLLPRPGLWISDNRCLITSAQWQSWACHPRNEATLTRQLQVAGLSVAEQNPGELNDDTILDAAVSTKLSRLPNLRKGKFAQVQRVRWTVPAVAALLVAAAFLGALNWQVSSIKSDLVAEQVLLQRQEVALFKEVFPKKSRIVHAKKQMEQEARSLLNSLESHTEPGEFLPRLAYVAEVVGVDRTKFTLTGLKFDQKSNSLTLYLSGDSMASLQSLAESLRNDTFQTALSSAREIDSGYAAVLEMSER